jgi:transcriptional regulator with XRE-family HTH domain
MNVSQVQERLRSELLGRIAKGTLSVSLLSRISGLGQSHLSNFLHSKRKLSVESMDAIMSALRLPISALLPHSEGGTVTHTSKPTKGIPSMTLYEENGLYRFYRDRNSQPIATFDRERAAIAAARSYAKAMGHDQVRVVFFVPVDPAEAA